MSRESPSPIFPRPQSPITGVTRVPTAYRDEQSLWGSRNLPPRGDRKLLVTPGGRTTPHGPIGETTPDQTTPGPYVGRRGRDVGGVRDVPRCPSVPPPTTGSLDGYRELVVRTRGPCPDPVRSGQVEDLLTWESSLDRFGSRGCKTYPFGFPTEPVLVLVLILVQHTAGRVYTVLPRSCPCTSVSSVSERELPECPTFTS